MQSLHTSMSWAVVAHHDGLAGGAARGRMQLAPPRPRARRTGRRGTCRACTVLSVNGSFCTSSSVRMSPGRHAEGVHALAVPRHALVGPGHLGLELLQLQRADLLARGALPEGRGRAGRRSRRPARREGGTLRGQVGHGLTSRRTGSKAVGAEGRREALLPDELHRLAPPGSFSARAQVLHGQRDVGGDERVGVGDVDAAASAKWRSMTCASSPGAVDRGARTRTSARSWP